MHLIGASLALFAACSFAQPTQNIVQLAEGNKDLSTLVKAVTAAGLVDTLSGTGPFTVFAPTNEAFAKLPNATLNFLLKPENKASLAKVLTYHVLAAKVESKDITEGLKAKTVEGNDVTAYIREQSVYILGGKASNFAKVVTADVEATNGVVHVVDTVLIPPDMDPTENIVELAEATPDLSTLVKAVSAAGLVDTLSGTGPFTVFAPTNEAFQRLPAGVLDNLLKPENKDQLTKVLTYHVLAGKVESKDITEGLKATTVEGKNITAYIREKSVYILGGKAMDFARVIAADVEATNGVVHVIDNVLLPPDLMSKLLEPTQNIVQLAEATPDLSTLVKAVSAAGLVDTLSGPGPFTVFAPSNEAFEKLPGGLLDSLLKPENKEALTKVLTYHVLAAKVMSKDITEGLRATTVEGKNVSAYIVKGSVYIVGGETRNYAKVTTADVEASNGVVHIIDTVLLPPDMIATQNIVELAEGNKDLSTLVKAVTAAGLVDTLSGTGPFTVFAPTNQAFERLPAGTLDNLLKPENKDQLVKVLTYHVLGSKVESKDITEGLKAKTVEGKEISAYILERQIFVVGSGTKDIARVLAADVEATNGVVHVIDNVLLPSDL